MKRPILVWASMLAVALLLGAGSPVTAAPIPVRHEPIIRVQHPKGIAIVLHSGAWLLTGQPSTATARPTVNRLTARGWLAVNVDYRLYHEIHDTLAATRWALHRRPQLPVCLYGQSAGGHLALVAASRLTGVDCIIVQGALVKPDDPALDAWGTRPITFLRIARYLFKAAVHTTANPLWLARHHRLDRAPILVEHNRQDGVTSTAHVRRFCHAAQNCRLDLVDPGPGGFFHNGISLPDQIHTARLERRALGAAARAFEHHKRHHRRRRA